MRLRSMLVLAVILGGSLLVAFPDGGALAASPPPAAARLALATTPLLDHKGHVIPGKYLVVATLTTADGKPLSNQSITFFEQQEFLGTMRQVGLGMATTDATGTAAVAYQPAQAGAHALAARFVGDAQVAAADANTTLTAARVVSPFPAQPAPLASVRHWLEIGVVLLVVAFWAFLAGMFLWTVGGIRSAARSAAAGGAWEDSAGRDQVRRGFIGESTLAAEARLNEVAFQGSNDNAGG